MSATGDLMAIVPAAGRGTRLGLETPKVFVELEPGLTAWAVLLEALSSVVGEVHLVLSPEGIAHYDALGRPARAGVRVTTSLQREPRGMGDAVFGAIDHWRSARNVLVLWGDQVGLSRRTLALTADTQRAATPPSVTLPLIAAPGPYVHYVFDAARRLVRVDQAREGDACPEAGLADVGLFAFSVAGAEPAWMRYVTTSSSRGARTGEINLLPFFAHLSMNEGFAVHTVSVDDPDEARGINTADDLAFARARRARGR